MKVRETLRALRDQERAPGCTVKVGTVFQLSGMAMGRLLGADFRTVGRQFPGRSVVVGCCGTIDV